MRPHVYLCRHEWGQWEPLNDGSEQCECLRDGCTYTLTQAGGAVVTRFDPFTDYLLREYTAEQRQAQADYLQAMYGEPGRH